MKYAIIRNTLSIDKFVSCDVLWSYMKVNLTLKLNEFYLKSLQTARISKYD
jgi:hypothetical protein